VGVAAPAVAARPYNALVVPDNSALSSDTDAESERHQIARWRALSSAAKLGLVDDLNAAVDAMALAGIRQRHPHASPREQFLRLARVKLGPDLAAVVYPEVAELD
jgi:hypothetical protein